MHWPTSLRAPRVLPATVGVLCASISCSSPTEPRVEDVELGIRVHWAMPDLHTATRLSVNGAVVEVRRGGTLIGSASVPVNPSLEEIPLTVLIPGNATGPHVVSARFQSSGTTLYEQAGNLTLPLAPGATVPLTIVYSGPGASATQLEATAVDTVVPMLGSTTLSATARAGTAVVPTPIHWMLEEPTRGSITPQGVFTAGTVGGDVVVRAVSENGLYDDLTLTVRVAADELQAISGASQVVQVGGGFAPFRVRALREGAPVAGLVINWDHVGVELALDEPGVTDADGYAEVGAAAGTTPGTAEVRAAVDGQLVTFPVEVVAGPPATMLELQYSPPRTYQALRLSNQAPRVVVQDDLGNSIEGVPVTFAVTAGGGTLASADPVLTNAAGIAVAPAWTPGPLYGEQTITATTPCPAYACLEAQLTHFVTLFNTAGRHFPSGTDQSGPVGTPYPEPVVFNIGPAVANVPIGVQVLRGEATVALVSDRTDASGQVSAIVTPRTPGAIGLRFYVDEGPTGHSGLDADFVGVPVGFTHAWLGASASWGDPANWSAGSVPTGTDSVYIPEGTPFAPTLDASRAVGALVHLDARPVTLDGNVLTVHGGLVSATALVGGRVDAVESGGYLAGGFDTLRVLGDRALTGSVSAARVVVGAGAELDVRALGVSATDSLVLEGFLRMNDERGVVVARNARFDSPVMGDDLLTAGTLFVNGDFIVSGSFRASGTHWLRLMVHQSTPQAAHRIAIANPAPGNVRVQRLEVYHGQLTLETDLHVAGDASVHGQMFVAEGAHWTIGGALSVISASRLDVAGALTFGSCSRDPASVISGFSCPVP